MHKEQEQHHQKRNKVSPSHHRVAILRHYLLKAADLRDLREERRMENEDLLNRLARDVRERGLIHARRVGR